MSVSKIFTRNRGGHLLLVRLEVLLQLAVDVLRRSVLWQSLLLLRATPYLRLRFTYSMPFILRRGTWSGPEVVGGLGEYPYGLFLDLRLWSSSLGLGCLHRLLGGDLQLSPEGLDMIP